MAEMFLVENKGYFTIQLNLFCFPLKTLTFFPLIHHIIS